MLSSSLSSPPIPGRYLCSITSQIMVEPVITADGHTYEREAIEAWLRNNDTSPKTGQVLKHKELTPNWDKISDLGEFLAENPALEGSTELYLPKAWVRALVCDLKANADWKAVMGWFSKDRRLLTQPLEGSYTAFHLAADFGSPELLEAVCGQLEAQGCLEAIAHEAQTATASQSQGPIETFEMPSKSSDRAGSSPHSEAEAIASTSPAEPRLHQENTMVKALSLKGFKGRHLNTLLERALEQEDVLKAAQWLRLGAELEQPDVESGNSLLARCVCKGQIAAVKWLSEQGASLSSCNFEGNTPLHLSVIHDRLPVANFLLAMKADPKLENAQGQSALHLAILGQSPWMMAAFVGAEEAVLSPYHIALLHHDQCLMQALLEQGRADINALDLQGRSPLWIASERGDLELVELLLTKGAELERACGVEAQRALHIAAQQGHEAVVALLIVSKAEIEATDLKGNTALHLAAQAGSEAVSNCLLEAGAYHKAKNHENQTPMELARQHHQLQVANFIEKKARTLKHAKLETIEVLRKVTEEQAKRIVELEQRLLKQAQELEQQEQKVTELDEAVVELLPKSGFLVLSSFRALRLAPMTKTVRAVEEAKRARAEVAGPILSEFLRLVAEGEQGKAELMLQSNPELALFPGNVMDLSKRTFENITGFQYAVWALDWHMWKMLLKYLSPEEAQRQAEQFELGPWVRKHGVHAGSHLKRLIDALKTYMDQLNNWGRVQKEEYWKRQVGGAQLLLPINVFNEYCNPNRSFEPCPNFEDMSELPRTRKVCIDKWYEDVLTATWNGGHLGNSFGIYRWCETYWGVAGAGADVPTTGHPLVDGVISAADHRAITTLCSTRIQQRERLITALSNRGTQEPSLTCRMSAGM